MKTIIMCEKEEDEDKFVTNDSSFSPVKNSNASSFDKNLEQKIPKVDLLKKVCKIITKEVFYIPHTF